MNKIKSILAGCFSMALLFSGCTNTFEAINTDPDNASEVPPTNILAYALRYTSAIYGGTSCISGPGAWGGQTAEIQYIAQSRYESYGYGGTLFNDSYYYVLNNLTDIIRLAGEQDNANLGAVAKIWMCYNFHTMTDQLGALPYFDALQGKDLLKPQYTTSEDIYLDIFNALDSCNTVLAANSGTIGEGDILYGGSALAWQKFANSLRLRMAMRVSNSLMADRARSIVSTMLSNPSQYPLCLDNSDNCMMQWPATGGYYEPWYNNTLTRDDYAIGDIIVDQLYELDDPRLAVYASPITSKEEDQIARALVFEGNYYRGAPIGPAGQDNLFGVSRMGTSYRDTPDGFTPHLRAAEVWLNIAEAAALGWTTAYDAATAYANGVTCSMQENGIDAGRISNYLAGKAGYKNMDDIHTQLWLAVFKDGNEAWAIYRKTGIPKTHHLATGTKYPDHNTVPFSYPYPTSEYDYNHDNVAQFQTNQSDGDYMWAKRMFWDVRPGVY